MKIYGDVGRASTKEKLLKKKKNRIFKKYQTPPALHSYFSFSLIQFIWVNLIHYVEAPFLSCIYNGLFL